MALSIPGQALTVGTYLAEWLDLQRTQLQHSTWSSYRATVRRYVLPHLADAPLAELTLADVTDLYALLLDRGGADGRPLGVRSVGYVHAILHKAFEDAIAIDLLEANPTHRARRPRRTGAVAGNGLGRTSNGEAAPGVDIWTAAQLRIFLAHVRHHELRELFVVAAFTGLRRGELLGLAWDDVDLPGASLRVRQSLSVIHGAPRLKPPKTGRVRTLHLDEATVEALHRQRERQDDDQRTAPSWDNPWNLVFTGRTGRYHSPDSVSNRFRRAVDRAPVPRARLHHLRHLHATLLLQAGVPVKVVSERLGHATTQLTLDIYAHVLPAMDAEAIRQFAALVLTGESEHCPEQRRPSSVGHAGGQRSSSWASNRFGALAR